MCDCGAAIIDKGYIISEATYDEGLHDFINIGYYMPLYIEERNKNLKLKVNCCPICGEKLGLEK